MSEKVIYISTWGSPWSVYPEKYRWQNVNYVLSDEEKCSVSSKTTLSFILRCRSPPPHRFVVIIPSTVIFNPNVESYEELIKHVKDIYRDFIDQEVGVSSLKSLDFIVAPGVGRFTNRYERNNAEEKLKLDYCGSLSNFYYYVYMELSKILVREVLDILKKNSEKRLEIILDLSHGINYMPVLTYRAVKDLAGVASIFLEKSILTVVNSEPVETSGSKTSIHTVEKIVDPRPEPLALESSKGLLVPEGRCLREYKDKDIEKIRKDIDEMENEILKIAGLKTKRDIIVFASSIENGYPLLALTTMPEEVELEKTLDYLRNCFHRFTIVEGIKNRVTKEIKVKYLAKYTTNIPGFIKSLMIAEILKKGRNIQKSVEATLETINKIAELWKLYRDKTTRITKETYSLKESIRRKAELCNGSYRSLNEAKGETDKKSCDYIDKEKDRFERNFFAHAGLERCVTQFKCENPDEDKIYLKYSEKHLDSIIDVALKQIPRP